MKDWRLWVIFILVLVAGVALGFGGRRLLTPTQLPLISPPPLTRASPAPLAGSTYQNEPCQFTVDYPGGWTLSPDATGTTITSQAGEEVNIACQSDIPRPPLTPDKIEAIVVDGVNAELYHDVSARDGSPVDKVIGDIPGSDLDFYLAGYGEAFDNLVSSFRWVQ